MSTFARFQRTIVNGAGDIQAGAQITVRDRNAALSLANLYSDRAGATPITNPFNADSNGFAAFFCRGSAYQITATLGSFSITWDYEGIGTAGEADVGDILVGVAFQAEWVTAHLYNVNDLVTHNGSTFICILGHTSGSTTEPGVGVSYATNWAFIAKRGNDAPKWLFNTAVTNADPGTGQFKFDNATLASVTKLYISESGSEFNNPDYSAYIALWGTGTEIANRGYLLFRSVLNPSKYALFRVVGTTTASCVTDNGAWDTVTSITLVSSAGGAFLASEEVGITWTKNGEAGKGGAFRQTYDTTTTTNADPGNGILRMNNTDLSLVTQIAMDDLDFSGAITVRGVIAAYANSTSINKGYLSIQRRDAATTGAAVTYKVISIVQQTGYTQVNVAYVGGSTSMSNTIDVIVGFSPSGDAGNSDFRSTYDSSSTTMADPGSGKFRLSNASPASTGSIAISATSIDAAALNALLTSINGSTNVIKAYVTVAQQDNPGKFMVWGIVKVTDNTTWLQLDGYPVGAVTSFNNAIIHQFDIARSGDVGLPSPRLNWDGTTQAMADPGSGKFRFDNATPASVTNIAISATDADGQGILAYLKEIGLSTSVAKGYFAISQQNVPNKRMIFQVTGITDNTTWVQLTGTVVSAVAFDATIAAGGWSYPTPCVFATYRTGDRGSPQGLRWQYDSTTAMADPGSGKFRLNNATLASVTALAISYNNGETGNPASDAFIKTWDDSTTPVHGLLTLIDADNPNIFAQYNVTGTITDNTTWLQVTLAYVGGSGAFSTSSLRRVCFQFSRTGEVGAPVGLHFQFATSTSMADPGAGLLRLNNATLASVTAIAIDDQLADPGNPAVDPYITKWADSSSTVKGYLKIAKKNAEQNFAIYAIQGTPALVDNVGWTQLNVAHIASAGSFAANDDLSVQFTRNGDVGSPTFQIEIQLGDTVNDIVTGLNGIAIGPFDFTYTIQAVTALAKQSGSISIEMLKTSYANYDAGATHPVSPGDKISGSAPIALSSALKYQDTSLTGWSPNIAVGDIISPNVASVTGIKFINICFKCLKTS
jgi:hypothetical protein